MFFNQIFVQASNVVKHRCSKHQTFFLVPLDATKAAALSNDEETSAKKHVCSNAMRKPFVAKQ